MKMRIWLAAMLVTSMSSLTSASHAGQFAAISIVEQSSGTPLKVWRHAGRNYVVGKPGDRYAVVIKNKGTGRLLSVVSVDGVNVLDGATAATNQAGYVIEAWQSVEIKGWRKNMDEVAAFYFTQLPDSYAARTGRPDHVGVIGVALFQEYVEPAMQHEQKMDSAATAAAPQSDRRARNIAGAGSTTSAAEAPLGTGHGERVSSATRMTEFRRAGAQPSEIITIHYDTYSRLVARGVIPRPYDKPVTPHAFPGNFVPDPS